MMTSYDIVNKLDPYLLFRFSLIFLTLRENHVGSSGGETGAYRDDVT